MAATTVEHETQLMAPVKEFVDGVRTLFAEGWGEDELWNRIAKDLRTLLNQPELQNHTATWPDTKVGDGPPSNLLFYEDPDYRFVLNALIKSPGSITNIHDHGPSWTLYGVLEGGEHIKRYRRTDKNSVSDGPAKLEYDGAFDVTPGYIDIVPPWQIHQEINGNHRTIGFIVRSQRSGTFSQFRYNVKNGDVSQFGGPSQIPLELR